ncbi:MAG: peroxiredoxin [Candidatus Babeliaceae bacterium]|nr:peroxiredoxin [Candidatus Babeliaceae bacterium]
MEAKINMPAPEFSLEDSDGSIIKLSDFKGKKVIVYFFPKTDTPGCTKEACSFRDSYDVYDKNNIIVIGISYDSPEMLKAFRQKYHLPFILLSDNEKKVARDYGAYKSLLNALFPARITALINEQGILTHLLDNVNVTTHAQDILELLSVPQKR